MTEKASRSTALPPMLFKTDMQYSDEHSKSCKEVAGAAVEGDDVEGTSWPNSSSDMASMSTKALAIFRTAKKVYLMKNQHRRSRRVFQTHTSSTQNADIVRPSAYEFSGK